MATRKFGYRSLFQHPRLLENLKEMAWGERRNSTTTTTTTTKRTTRTKFRNLWHHS
jgi:hypothetical protein